MRVKYFYRHLLIAAGLATGIIMAISAIPALAQNQPHMQAAMRSLQQARNQLAASSTNKGGHRERAMRLVDQAINETQGGMAYARQHPGQKGRQGQYRSEQQRRYEEQHRREQQGRYEEQHRRGPHATPTPHGHRTPYPSQSPQGPGH